MPKFTAMKPSEVLVGRARLAAEERKSYVEALRSAEAGKVELAGAEKSVRVKRLLVEASKESGIRIRSSWEDKSHEPRWLRQPHRSHHLRQQAAQAAAAKAA